MSSTFCGYELMSFSLSFNVTYWLFCSCICMSKLNGPWCRRRRQNVRKQNRHEKNRSKVFIPYQIVLRLVDSTWLFVCAHPSKPAIFLDHIVSFVSFVREAEQIDNSHQQTDWSYRILILNRFRLPTRSICCTFCSMAMCIRYQTIQVGSSRGRPCATLDTENRTQTRSDTE